MFDAAAILSQSLFRIKLLILKKPESVLYADLILDLL